MRYEFPLVPVPKPRMTRADAWRKRPCVLRYRAFADELKKQAEDLGFTVPASGLSLEFHLQIAKTVKREVGSPHQQRPDIDNLVKAFLDALCDEDSYVWNIRAEKRWSQTPFIVALTD